MTIFLTGGVRSGKSSLAQQFALRLSTGTHYYVATMIPVDDDDRQRILLHLSDRQGMGFQTIEQGRNIEKALDAMKPNATVLLDSVTALLMNELYREECNFVPDNSAAERITAGLEAIVKYANNVIFVSDYLFSDAVFYDSSTEMFRKSLGTIHRHLAGICDIVIEVNSGNLTIHKGVLPQ